ncbi:Rho termination factor N-terminal domain-containing protein, partial [Intrasporangium sp.]|uniref:Rho termination factor N-terminal domain-containing protein n=1 Tax=Intrasporangium sp. TaxID=1925024 RepID=UPI002939E9FD
MSETTTRPVSGLSAMKLDELKSVASSMGIKGTAKMRKGDLVEAIKARQSGGAPAVDTPAPARASRRVTRAAGAAEPAAPREAGPEERSSGSRPDEVERAERAAAAVAAATSQAVKRDDRGSQRESRGDASGPARADDRAEAKGRQQGDRPQSDRPQSDRPQSDR